METKANYVLIGAFTLITRFIAILLFFQRGAQRRLAPGSKQEFTVGKKAVSF